MTGSAGIPGQRFRWPCVFLAVWACLQFVPLVWSPAILSAANDLWADVFSQQRELEPDRNDSNTSHRRRTLGHTLRDPRARSILPVELNLTGCSSPWSQMAAIMAGTFVLEDPTCVTVGLLVRDGQLDLFLGVLACFAGIFVGDLALYVTGYFVGRRALRWRPVAKRLPVHHLDSLGRWFDRHGWGAVLASRFVPGTRLPLYISAGVLGHKPWRFVIWTCLAVMIWAPMIVLMVVLLGPAAVTPFQWLFGEGWLSLVAAVLFILVMIRVISMTGTRIGRARLTATICRVWRWEFWPVWLFYAPLVPWIGYLAVRYRGLNTLTAVNPAIEHSGVVGESKYAILKQLPDRWTMPSELVGPGALAERVVSLKQMMAQRHWAFPLILKPDVGERGVGVKLIGSLEDAAAYFERVTSAVLAQTYHPGPYEAGIFYYRMPNQAIGCIFSITDKQFPAVTGDGCRTLEQLIWSDTRLRMQARTFLARHEIQRDRVLDLGQTYRLAVAGNHCQGTMFRDGNHLITPQLEQAIDRIARGFDGFYYGRFDIRYNDPEALRAGQGMVIIELNGVTSESTNIYDPSQSLLGAYAILMRQWSLAFEIGHINRRAGGSVTPFPVLLKTIFAHYRRRTADTLSD